jgi:hypothetical protein
MTVGVLTPFDAVIPFHSKDADVLPYCVMGLRRYTTGLRNIYVVSKDDPEEDDIIWIPETSFPFTIADVQSIIQSTNGRAGWYFQQLLKLYAFRVIPGILPHALLFDADCVICRPVSFFRGGKILLDWSEKQNHAAYFTHAKAIMGDLFNQPDPEKSGITDHMMVHQPVMEGLLQKIESRGFAKTNHIDDFQAWRIFLKAVDPAQRDFSGMSEYEIYYNYALTWFWEDYEIRQLQRGAGTSFRALAEGSAEADIIAFHAWAVDLHKTQIESSRTAEAASDGRGSAPRESAGSVEPRDLKGE